ncbi:MAG: lycopene cyclase family protein [Minwuiales bacterium]|nr:lycopene cyclase family protein [Minwuiales bacterium]
MAIATDIAVIGAGPAGTATAIGLSRLGYRVTVLHRPRGYPAAEGLSARVRDGLHAAGCRNALAAIGEPARREATWNGETTGANQEFLVQRQRFDIALIEDLKQAGIDPIHCRVEKVEQTGIVAKTESGDALAVKASFVVDARGRAAPAGKRRRVMGPPTTALVQRWSGPPGPPRTCVASFADGWAWFAAPGDGKSFLQIALDSRPGVLPKRVALQEHFLHRIDEVPGARDWLADARIDGPVTARNATATMNRAPVEAGLLRVGDATLAVDPLSGHGMFQALSTALAAPAVINTLLRRPQDTELAERFYRDRVTDMFYRFARIGRDFYRLESRWRDRAFWRDRAPWPDNRAAHAVAKAGQLTLARKPVIEDGYIVERDVAVTPDYPLGVWRVAGIELAPVIRDLEREPQIGNALAARIAQRSGADDAAVRTVMDWLAFRGVIATG